MTRQVVVDARPIASEKASELVTLELLKNESVPGIGERLTFNRRAYLVVGILDYGDGHGPIALAVLDTEEAEQALS